MSSRWIALGLSLGLFGCGAGTAEPPATPPAPTAAPQEDEPKEDNTGTIDVQCNPPVKVLIDGKEVGESPITGHKVAAGSHDVTCDDEEGGSRTLTVQIDAHDSKNVSSNRVPKIQESQTPAKDGKDPKPKKK
jgi:hypothetical protein